MKTSIFTISFIVLFVLFNTSQAQVPFTFGVKAGIALSNTNIEDYDMLVGASAGIIMDYNITKNIYIRSGLDFVMKGAKYNSFSEVKQGGWPVKYFYNQKARLNYIQMPLMLGYRYKVASGTHVFISGGAYFAYGIYGKGKYTLRSISIENGKDTEHIESEKFKDFDDMYLKDFDLGVVGAIGAEYGNYSINVGYEYGLVNLGKNRSSTVPYSGLTFISNEKQSWHNMNATCTLGYRF